MDNTRNKITITIMAMITVLIFFSIQGTAVFIFRLTGAAARLIPALVLWVLAAAAFVFFKIIKMPLSEVGFRTPIKGALKKLYYLIPLAVIGASGLIGGIDLSQGIGYIFACLFYVLAIAVSEEIYFRGIICNIWKNGGYKKAVIISAALFGACHVLQAMANPDLLRTILAICFAFFYGIAFAQIFLLTKSILPGMMIHAFHDFCSFIGNSVGSEMDLVLGIFQTIVILIFICLIHFSISETGVQKDEKTESRNAS
ncbi:MAG: CPBP family intramembrane glutamic endopeptidase [Huintestinicola sp.]|uniref:CPBP family intramembrane glutamic endopeptidase n=1 Tax=Huintestinicola sp. TaxID=2981661 RepID=UPI003F08CE3B